MATCARDSPDSDRGHPAGEDAAGVRAYSSAEISTSASASAIFERDWVCAGVVDEMPAAGSWTARVVGGLPVLFVRDKAGELRAFLNVCRHRASPLCEDGEAHAGSLIRCPYHSWLYQLDGSLARAVGCRLAGRLRRGRLLVEARARWPQWRRMVFVCFDDVG